MNGDFLGPICPDEFEPNDLYEQFLNIKVGETDSFILTDADGNSARYVKDPFPEFRWCKGCREYDQEKHCCHRFSTVIREAVAELNQVYATDESGCDGKDYCEINVGGVSGGNEKP